VLGVALLAALVAQNDPAAVLTSIADLSWRLGIVVFFPAVLVALARAALAAIRRPTSGSRLADRVQLDRRRPHPLSAKLS